MYSSVNIFHIYFKVLVPLLFVRSGRTGAPMWPGPILAVAFIFNKTVSNNYLARRQHTWWGKYMFLKRVTLPGNLHHPPVGWEELKEREDPAQTRDLPSLYLQRESFMNNLEDYQLRQATLEDLFVVPMETANRVK